MKMLEYAIILGDHIVINRPTSDRQGHNFKYKKTYKLHPSVKGRYIINEHGHSIYIEAMLVSTNFRNDVSIKIFKKTKVIFEN